MEQSKFGSANPSREPDGTLCCDQLIIHSLFSYHRYNAAKLSLDNRSAQVAMVKESLERDMELLCVTGVEDKLQVYFTVPKEA